MKRQVGRIVDDKSLYLKLPGLLVKERILNKTKHVQTRDATPYLPFQQCGPVFENGFRPNLHDAMRQDAKREECAEPYTN
jgi:hypothetical protein